MQVIIGVLITLEALMIFLFRGTPRVTFMEEYQRNCSSSRASGFPAQQSTGCRRHPQRTRALSWHAGISIDSAEEIPEDFFLWFS